MPIATRITIDQQPFAYSQFRLDIHIRASCVNLEVPYRALEHITAGRRGNSSGHLRHLLAPFRDAIDCQRVRDRGGGSISDSHHINIQRSRRAHIVINRGIAYVTWVGSFGGYLCDRYSALVARRISAQRQLSCRKYKKHPIVQGRETHLCERQKKSDESVVVVEVEANWERRRNLQYQCWSTRQGESDWSA